MDDALQRMDDKMDPEGIWVFVSHSTKDFERVRLVRNALEESGFRPILFYLKSVTDDSEISGLLKREIDARKRFILCDSPNARSSKYVKSEVDYIRSKSRMYEVIDLAQIHLGDYEKDEVMGLLKSFRIRSQVFLSYLHHDKELARELEQSLINEGFKVETADAAFDFALANIPGGVAEYSSSVDFLAFQCIRDTIANTLDNGYLLCLISKESYSSSFQQNEIQEGLKYNPNRILPVIIDDIELDSIPIDLQKHNVINVGKIVSNQEKVKSIVDSLISHDLSLHP